MSSIVTERYLTVHGYEHKDKTMRINNFLGLTEKRTKGINTVHIKLASYLFSNSNSVLLYSFLLSEENGNLPFTNFSTS